MVRATPVRLVQSAAHAHRAQEAEEVFRQHGGDDAEVDAAELMTILNETFAKGLKSFYLSEKVRTLRVEVLLLSDFTHGEFDMTSSKRVLASKDADRTGKLELDEFKQLWSELEQWKVCVTSLPASAANHNTIRYDCVML